MFPPWRRNKDSTHNWHANDDSIASIDYSSEIIYMDENGSPSFIYNPDFVQDQSHVPPPKTQNSMRHTMAQQDSPAKVFAKMKSQLQREHHPLTEVASNHPALVSNLFPKPHLSCEKRLSEDDVKNVGSVRRRLVQGKGCCSQTKKTSSAVFKANDVPDNTNMEGFGSVVGNALPYNNLYMTASRADVADSQTAVTADPLLCHNLPQTCISNKRLRVHLERLPPMSPAKLFVHIKEKERNRRIHEGSKDGCSTMTLHQRESSMDPISESKLEGADDPGGDVQPFVVDPILVGSPKISFRKIREDGFKWPAKPSKNPPQKVKVTGVYLTRWMLKSNSAGLYVDGIRKADKQPWHSSVIVERLSNNMLRTSSGKTYNLVGKMFRTTDSDFPQWFLKKFTDGFPEDWRILYEKLRLILMTIRKTSKKVRLVKSSSEEAVTNQSVTRQKPNGRHTAVPSCSPTTSANVGMTVSRSGRIIKPPLDYWKGGRVVMDKDMNMTIHDSYETTFSLPQVEAEMTVSQASREEKTRREQNDSEMAPLRRVKLPPCHRNRARTKSEKQTGGHNKPLNTDLSIPEGFSRRSTSIAEITAIQPALCTGGVPESEANSNRSSRQRSKSPKRQRLARKCNPPANSDPSTADQASDSSNDLLVKRNSRKKRTITASSASSDDSRVKRKSAKVLKETGSKTRKILNKGKLKEDSSDSSYDFLVIRNSQKKGTNVLSETGSSASSDESWVERKSAKVLKETGSKARINLNKGKLKEGASDSSNDFWVKRNSQKKRTNVLRETGSSASSDESRVKRKSAKVLKETGSKARKNVNKGKLKEDDEDQWSVAELARLQKAVNQFPKHLVSFWDSVAQMVGTRSVEECQREQMPQGIVKVPTKRTKTSKKKEEPVNDPEPPKITAGVGTLKRKQQVRQLMKAMPKEDYDDAFTNASMFANRFQFPTTLSCEESDDEFVFPDMEPVTPGTAGFPTVKTPRCHHIDNEDMLRSVNRDDDDDRCVFQLQKKMKKSRANVHLDRRTVKDTKPSMKRSEKRLLNGENDSFLVWETRPDSASFESGEEEDFYFEED